MRYATILSWLTAMIAVASVSLGAETLPMGPGVGGQVHAVAFDPDDQDLVYAGGDICGVYRYSIAAGTWSAWSQGLDNGGLNYSYYVDDILVVGSDSQVPVAMQGVYAATHGGVYFRRDDSTDWELITPGLDYEGGWASVAFDNSGKDTRLQIPFSCLTLDEANGVIYAGAGHGRSVRNQPRMDIYYPTAGSSVDYPNALAGPDSQYSLWRIDLSTGGAVVAPVVGSQHGNVRRVIWADHAAGTEVIYACDEGIFTYTHSAGKDINLWPRIEKSGGALGVSEDPWGIGVGYSGTLFALMSRDTIPDGSGGEIAREPGVFTFDLLGDRTTDKWHEFGPAGADTFLWPYTETWQSFVAATKRDLTELTVVPGNGVLPDQLFVGERKTPDYRNERGGYFRFGRYQNSGASVDGWAHIHRTNAADDVIVADWVTGDIVSTTMALTDVGWMGEHSPDLFSLVPFAVSSADPSLMVAVDYHIPLISTNGGATWSNLYCTGDPVSGWRAKGLNIMAATCSDVLSDGRLVLGANDFGVFLESSTDSTKFHLLYDTGWPSAIDVESVNYAGTNEIYFVDDYHLRDDGTRTDRILAYDADADDGVWRDIGAGIMSNHVSVMDVELVSPTRMFVAIANDEDSPKVYHVFEGTRPDTGAGFAWVWQDWFDPGANVRIINSLHHIPGTDLLLMGAKARWGDGTLYEGGVYCLDISDQTAPLQTWIAGNAVGDGKLFRNVRCFASDETGDHVYVGTSGGDSPFSIGRGGVIALVAPFTPSGFDSLAYLANGPTMDDTFGLAGISNFPTNPNALDWEYVTQISDIQIDPANPLILYIALGCRGFYDRQYGAWRCDLRSGTSDWSQVSGGVDGYSSSARTVCIDPARPGELYVGTAGQEFLRTARIVSPVPVVSTTAEYAISPDGDDYSILAVSGTARDGGPLATVYVDATALGGPADLELNDSGPAGGVPGDAVAGDDIWSAALTNPLPAGSEFTAPLVARDSNWNTYTGDLAVQVAIPTGKFEDKSAGTGDLGTVTGVQNVAVPLDYDGDNLQDILIGRQDEVGVLMRADNQLGGVPYCTDVTSTTFPVVKIDAGTLSLVSADLDNDGDEDIFVCSDQTPRLFRYDATTATYTDATASIFLSPASYNSAPTHAFAAAWADYDGDGWVDLAVIGRIDGSAPPGYPGGVANLILYRNVHGRLYYSSAAATAVAAEGYVLNNPPLYVMWSDPNDDARPDLFFSDVAGSSPGARLFVNQGFSASLGDYGFADLTAAWFGGGRGPDKVAAAVFFDYNNDGRQDLVVARSGAQDNLLLYENTGTAFSAVDKSAWATGDFAANLSDVIVRDLDLNGSEDIVAVPEIDAGRPRVLLGDRSGAGRFVEFSQTGLDLSAVSGGFAHTWGSAMPAVYLAKGAGGAAATSFLFGFTKTAAAAGNTFTRVMVNPANAMNSSGLGTKITVEYTRDGESTPTRLTRWISGAAGRRGQQAKMVEFGLGSYSGNNVEMSITWPDGTVHTGAHLVSARVDSTFIDMAGKYYDLPAFIPQTVNKQQVNVKSSFIVGADDENYWEFEWDMTAQVDPVLVFQRSTSPAACSCMTQNYAEVTLRYGDPDVELDVVAIAEGVYHHTLRWHAPCCEAGCSFDYELTCSLGSSSVASGTHTCSTGTFCLSGF